MDRVFRRGRGPATIMVHGGPGLAHDYLEPWFRPFEERRELIYYDQLGCGVDASRPAHQCTADLDVELLVEIVQEFSAREPVDVLAHSWGGYLALRAAAEGRVRSIFLISPFGLHAGAFAASGERLQSRIPASIGEEYGRLASAGAGGKQLMELILPYYLGDPESTSRPQVEFFRPDVNGAVFQSLGAFDIRPCLDRITGDVHVILGARDFITPDDHVELRERASTFQILPEAGHFAFAECPAAFAAALMATGA